MAASRGTARSSPIRPSASIRRRLTCGREAWRLASRTSRSAGTCPHAVAARERLGRSHDDLVEIACERSLERLLRFRSGQQPQRPDRLEPSPRVRSAHGAQQRRQHARTLDLAGQPDGHPCAAVVGALDRCGEARQRRLSQHQDERAERGDLGVVAGDTDPVEERRDGASTLLEQELGRTHAGIRDMAGGPIDQMMEPLPAGQLREARCCRAGLGLRASSESHGVVGQHEKRSVAIIPETFAPEIFGPEHDLPGESAIGLVVDRAVELDQTGSHALPPIAGGGGLQGVGLERSALVALRRLAGRFEGATLWLGSGWRREQHRAERRRGVGRCGDQAAGMFVVRDVEVVQTDARDVASSEGAYELLRRFQPGGGLGKQLEEPVERRRRQRRIETDSRELVTPERFGDVVESTRGLDGFRQPREAEALRLQSDVDGTGPRELALEGAEGPLEQGHPARVGLVVEGEPADGARQLEQQTAQVGPRSGGPARFCGTIRAPVVPGGLVSG